MLLKDEGKKYTPAPAGQHVGVCVDFVDLGQVTEEWKGKKKTVQKCRVVFEIGERMEDGRRFIVSQQFTASLFETSRLRKFLEAWRGVAFTPEELKGFETENLIGVNALLQVVHEPSKRDPSRIYANIQSVMRAPKALGWLEPAAKPDGSPEYIRVKDREDESVPPHMNPDDEPPPPDDDDLPF